MSKDISAFPDPGRSQSAKQRAVLTETGMALRDYFAAKAMQSFLIDVGCLVDTSCFRECADAAYRVADEMLKARKL